jgi:hypothetical protein
MTTGGIQSFYEEEVALRINCVIIPPRISLWYYTESAEHLAQVHLHRYVVIKKYIIVAMEQMSGEISFMDDPS